MASQQIDSREAHRRARAVVTAARERLAPETAARTAAVSERLERVLEAFAAERVGTQHFASLTGYGHGGQGRGGLERGFARVPGAGCMPDESAVDPWGAASRSRTTASSPACRAARAAT